MVTFHPAVLEPVFQNIQEFSSHLDAGPTDAASLYAPGSSVVWSILKRIPRKFSTAAMEDTLGEPNKARREGEQPSATARRRSVGGKVGGSCLPEG